MKAALVILVVAVIALAALFLQSQRAAKERLANAQAQLTATSNEVVAARTETGEVKTQLEQTTAALAATKAQAEEQSKALTAIQNALQEQKAKTTSLEKQNEVLTSEIDSVSNQLVAVEKNLAELQTTHATTVGHLTAMREEFVALTKEKAALESKLHDLKALKEQMRVVKQELHEQRVEEFHRTDRAQAAMGNGGFLLKDGQWTKPAPLPNYPLIEEIRRDQ